MGMFTKERVPQPSPRPRLLWWLQGQRGRCRGPARGLRRGGGDQGRRLRPVPADHGSDRRWLEGKASTPAPAAVDRTSFAQAPLSFCFSSCRTRRRYCSRYLPAPAPFLLLASYTASPFPRTSRAGVASASALLVLVLLQSGTVRT